MSAEEKVIDIIVEQLSVDKDKVVPGASFVDDLGADSLDLVELIMAMEEAFGIEIPDEVAEKLAQVVGVRAHRRDVLELDASPRAADHLFQIRLNEFDQEIQLLV